jgi:tetratricopeptide (TPR) repeat protein
MNTQKSIKKIFQNKQSGIFFLCGVFMVLAVVWFFTPKIISGIVRYQKELSRATVTVSLSREDRGKAEKEIFDMENSIRSSNKKGEENYASQYILLGEKLEYIGYRAKAVKAYQNAVKEDGKNIHAYAHLGAVLRAMGRVREAKDAYRTAIDLNPGSTTFYPTLAYIYAEDLKDSETGRGVFLEGLIRTNNNLELIKKYVPFLERIGETTEARLYQQEIVKKEPPSPQKK